MARPVCRPLGFLGIQIVNNFIKDQISRGDRYWFGKPKVPVMGFSAKLNCSANFYRVVKCRDSSKKCYRPVLSRHFVGINVAMFLFGNAENRQLISAHFAVIVRIYR